MERQLTGLTASTVSTRVSFVYIMALLFKYIETSYSTHITSLMVTISLITTITLNIGHALYQTSIVKTVTIVSRSHLTGVR